MVSAMPSTSLGHVGNAARVGTPPWVLASSKAIVVDSELAVVAEVIDNGVIWHCP